MKNYTESLKPFYFVKILKISFLAYFLLSMTVITNVQTGEAPGAGIGSTSNPYEMANLDNLYWIYANTTEWNKHYIQTADINAL
jgi:hypothetical protein